MTRICLALVFLTAVTTTVAAQSGPSLTRGTSLAATVGAARANGDTGVTAGGSASWELSTYFALEGSGRWFDRAGLPDAYAAELVARVGLGGARDSAVPYVVAGLGVHRRTFDLGPGALAPERVPAFFRRRLRVESGALGARPVFTDPTLVVGGGVDIALSRLVVVRPDVRALVVLGDGRHDTVVVATIGLGVRFEHKPVTPARR